MQATFDNAPGLWRWANEEMNERNKKMCAAVGLHLAQAILYLLGGIMLFWSVICYLGGPCPRPGDLHLHLIFGTIWLLSGLALAFGGTKLGGLARRQLEKRKMASDPPVPPYSEPAKRSPQG